MIPFPPSWDGNEPVLDALERNGLIESFESALAADDCATAVRALIAVGVQHGEATTLVNLALEALRARDN